MWWRNPWLRERRLLLSLAVFDGLLIAGTYGLLYLGRFDHWPGMNRSMVGLLILWLGCSYLLGRYSSRGDGRNENSLQRVLITAAVAALVLAIVVVILSWGLRMQDPRTYRRFLVPLLASVTLLSGLAQLWLLRQQRRLPSFLLVGESRVLEVVRNEIQRDAPDRQLAVTYYPVDESPQSDWLNVASELEALVGEGNYKGIAVSESAELDDALLQKLLALRSNGMSISSLMLWAEERLQRVPPELFSSSWLVQAEGFELHPGRMGWRLKRLGDLLVASFLLIVTAPLMLTAALLIRLEDGGPIFYGQERTGLFGNIIRVWKLRTMHTGAEVGGAQWARRGDPRITLVGGWLRKLRIDELPQLISVLKGEMSLIGPRPERPQIEMELEEKIPHYRTRHWVRPGLSGWAQVCYPYGASVADSRMKLSYDIFYLRNANLLLDFLILIKTIRLVFRAEGAQPQGARSPAPAGGDSP